MELNDFRSAWKDQAGEGHSLSAQSSRYLRMSAIHDLQRSEEFSRAVVSALFGLIMLGMSAEVMLTNASRLAALLFAAALFADGIVVTILLIRRLREPVTNTLAGFISREHRQLTTRLKMESYLRRLILLLAAVAVVFLIVGARPETARETALETMGRMAIMTGFLAYAWRRMKSRAGEIRRELEQCLKELEG